MGEDITGEMFGIDKIAQGVYTTGDADIETPEDTGTDEENHIITVALDSLVSGIAAICKENKIPPPEQATYTAFARPLINSAAWDAMPEANPASDTPKWMIYPVIAIALALVFLPTIYAMYQRYQENRAAELAEQENRAAEQLPPPIEPIYTQHPQQAPAPQQETPAETTLRGL